MTKKQLESLKDFCDNECTNKENCFTRRCDMYLTIKMQEKIKDDDSHIIDDSHRNI
jgi:hypothetical protein